VDPRAGLDDVEKRKFLTLPGLELQPLGRPACSQSLSRLSYPGSSTQYLFLCKEKGARERKREGERTCTVKQFWQN
jgi:hypothetical protein